MRLGLFQPGLHPKRLELGCGRLEVLLGGLDGDEPARAYILEQDREIAEKSGRPVLEIKSISRVGAKKK